MSMQSAQQSKIPRFPSTLHNRWRKVDSHINGTLIVLAEFGIWEVQSVTIYYCLPQGLE